MISSAASVFRYNDNISDYTHRCLWDIENSLSRYIPIEDFVVKQKTLLNSALYPAIQV